MSFFMSSGLLVSNCACDLSATALIDCGISEMLSDDGNELKDDYSTPGVARAIMRSEIWAKDYPACNASRHVISIPKLTAIVQRPLLLSYLAAGQRCDEWPDADADVELGGELLFEMPSPGYFSAGTSNRPGRVQYRDTSDVLWLAKRMYGVYLRGDFDYVANFVCVAGEYF